VVQYTAQPPANAALTGIPTAPTAAPLTNNTQISTTAYADASAFTDANAEMVRAMAAEALLAPLAGPVLTGNTQVNGDLSLKAPGAGTVLASAGTINPAGTTLVKVTHAANVTGIIISPGDQTGQLLYVLNASVKLLTFAAAATSNVVNGASEVIGFNEGRLYIWDATASRWMGATATGVLNAGAAYLLSPGAFEVDGVLHTYAVTDVAAGSSSNNSAPVITPTLGAAAQLADQTRDYMLYVDITLAGTALVIAIGPTSGVANVITTGGTASLGQVVSFRLPAAWYVKVTATTATWTTLGVGC
jgi:hypothetical protein